MNLKNRQGGWVQFIPLIASAVSAAGSIIGGKKAAKGQQDANETNIQLQREQQTWEKDMANTAVQRRMQDYQAAGLNPMLAYQSEAATPNVSAAKVENADAAYSDVGRSVGSAVQQGIQAQAIAAQTKNVQADTVKKQAETALTNQTAKRTEYETAITANNANNVGLQTKILEDQSQKLAFEISKMYQEVRKGDKEWEEMYPLLIEAQKLQNQGESLGIAEKKASSEWWKDIGEAGKSAPYIQKIIQLLMMMKAK